jgi:hypothetical protein
MRSYDDLQRPSWNIFSYVEHLVISEYLSKYGLHDDTALGTHP